MTRNEIILGVQTRMSELNDGEQVEVATNPFIDQLLDDCVYGYFALLPAHLLPATSFITGTTRILTGTEVYSQRIKLPEGFIKLIDFRLTGWYKTPLLTLEGTPSHLRQAQKYSFGGRSRPVVTLVNDLTLGKSLEFYYLSTESPVINTALCVVTTDPEDISDDLLNGFMWYVASDAYRAMELYDNSKMALEKVNV